jgi:Uma2 family endonuclease
MPLMISVEHLPATLTVPPMNDLEFLAFCSRYPEWFVEVSADGEVLIMPPNYPLNAIRSSAIVSALTTWANHEAKGVVTDATAGFVLPNGARRSPDAAWISRGKLATLTPTELDGFWHLCPEFIIELRRPSDRLQKLQEKMAGWMLAGADLGWMIDPENQTVEIYRPNAPVEVVSDTMSIVSDPPVEGFRLDLAQVWNPLS